MSSTISSTRSPSPVTAPAMGGRGPSIREIAGRLGISKSTVSLALSRDDDDCPLATATRQRILKTAVAMGYRPNSIARTMRTGRFNAIALVVGSITRRYLPAELAHGVDQTLAAANNHLIFGWLDDSQLTSDQDLPKVLEEWSSDGLLIHYTHRFPERARELIQRFHLPSIWINSKFEHDCVYPDDLSGARELTERLIGLGHRRIAYANFQQHGHYSEQDRQGGYEQAMKQAGLQPRVIQFHDPSTPGDFVEDNRWTWAGQALREPDRPTAIVCYEMATAGPLLCAAMAMGIRVPEELSIASFSRMTKNDTGRSISSLVVPMEQIGRRAAEMVLMKVAKPSRKLPAEQSPLQWLNGSTIGPIAVK